MRAVSTPQHYIFLELRTYSTHFLYLSIPRVETLGLNIGVPTARFLFSRVQLIFYKEDANERKTSLLGFSRVQLIFYKVNEKYIRICNNITFINIKAVLLHSQKRRFRWHAFCNNSIEQQL